MVYSPIIHRRTLLAATVLFAAPRIAAAFPNRPIRISWCRAFGRSCVL
jgi:hypothetical protein